MANDKTTSSKKGFFSRLLEALDKKMADQSQCGGCCCSDPKAKAPASTGKKCC